MDYPNNPYQPEQPNIPAEPIQNQQNSYSQPAAGPVQPSYVEQPQNYESFYTNTQPQTPYDQQVQQNVYSRQAYPTQPDPYAQPYYGTPYVPVQQETVPAYPGALPQKGKGQGIASFILGLSSMTGLMLSLINSNAFFLWFIVAFITAIIGIILGGASRKKLKEGNGLALAGLILSIIGAAFCVIILIIIIVIALAVTASISNNMGNYG